MLHHSEIFSKSERGVVVRHSRRMLLYYFISTESFLLIQTKHGAFISFLCSLWSVILVAFLC